MYTSFQQLVISFHLWFYITRAFISPLAVMYISFHHQFFIYTYSFMYTTFQRFVLSFHLCFNIQLLFVCTFFTCVVIYTCHVNYTSCHFFLCFHCKLIPITPVFSCTPVCCLPLDAPTLVTKKVPDMLHYFGRRRYGFRLNSKLLRAVDSDTDSGSLLYVITDRPRHGHLENTIAKRFVRQRYTQRDLDEDSLVFIIDPKSEATNDSFTFRVEDSRGNNLEDQRYGMSLRFRNPFILINVSNYFSYLLER